MYEKFYRLNGIPFQLTPDPRFFFGSASHSRAISHLVYGLSQQEGFIIITGEVGAGKTTLVEQLWAQLDRRNYAIGRVVTTQVSNDDLLGPSRAVSVRRIQAVTKRALCADLNAHSATNTPRATAVC